MILFSILKAKPFVDKSIEQAYLLFWMKLSPRAYGIELELISGGI